MTTDTNEIRSQDLRELTQRPDPGDIREFTAYCKEQSFASLPSRPAFVAAWLDHLVCEGMDKEKSSYPEVKLAVASIARAHKLRGDIDPTADELVSAIVKASRLLDAKLKTKKSKTNGTSH